MPTKHTIHDALQGGFVTMPWVQVSHTGVATLCSKPMNDELKDSFYTAIRSFGFILPRGKAVSLKSFAEMILQYCSDPRAQHIADKLSKAS